MVKNNWAWEHNRLGYLQTCYIKEVTKSAAATAAANRVAIAKCEIKLTKKISNKTVNFLDR